MNNSEFEDAYEDFREDTHPIKGTMFETPVSELMVTDPLVVRADTNIMDAVDAMNDNHIGCLLVEKEGQLVGIFTERDLLRKVIFREGNRTWTVERVMTKTPETLPPTASVAYALNKMSVDGYRHIPIVDKAGKAGVKVISYDRLIRGTASVDYYVTFDSFQVGAAWGTYLVGKVPAGAKGQNLYLYAGAASDNNAFIFFQGAWSVLQPKIADGTFIVRNSDKAVALMKKATLTRDEQASIIGQVTTNWNFADAKNKAEANLTAATAAMKGTVYICAPNDGTARSIADAFRADKAVKTYYITGQDAEIASIQYIIDGKQSMTVLKDVRTLVSDAIAAAVAYIKGQVPPKTATYNNGVVDVPAKPTAIVTVTKDNVKAAIVDSGYWPASNFTGLRLTYWSK